MKTKEFWMEQTFDPQLRAEISKCSARDVQKFGKIPIVPAMWEPQTDKCYDEQVVGKIRPLGCPEKAPPGSRLTVAWLSADQWEWNNPPFSLKIGEKIFPFLEHIGRKRNGKPRSDNARHRRIQNFLTARLNDASSPLSKHLLLQPFTFKDPLKELARRARVHFSRALEQLEQMSEATDIESHLKDVAFDMWGRMLMLLENEATASENPSGNFIRQTIEKAFLAGCEFTEKIHLREALQTAELSRLMTSGKRAKGLWASISDAALERHGHNITPTQLLEKMGGEKIADHFTNQQLRFAESTPQPITWSDFQKLVKQKKDTLRKKNKIRSDR